MNQAHQMKMQCQQYMNQPVHLQVNGQSGYSGIIEHVDDENVYVMVPTDEHGQYEDIGQVMMEMNSYGYMNEQQTQKPSQDMMRDGIDQRYPYFPYYPYYQPYPYYPYYPYPRPRRWSRLILPLAALTAIALL